MGNLEGIALILTALGPIITATLIAYVSIRQLPQIHKQVNTNYQKQVDEIEMLRKQIFDANAIALAKSEAREQFPLPPPPLKE